ncbi:MAG: PEP-CTERM sorting domain-containing protein [Candidatus Sumerlaeia bacterium]
MKSIKFTVALALLLCAPISHAGLINGDFSAGSTGWTSSGVVIYGSSLAILSDFTGNSGIYQGVQVTPGAGYLYQFDWAAYLGGAMPGTMDAVDTFTPSLYFVNDLSQFSLDPLNPVYDAVIHFGTIGGPLADGGTFTFYFTTPYQYVIPVFELYGTNLFPDSMVMIDNVRLTDPQSPVVPEPATLMLVGGGLAGLGLRLRRKR